MSEKADKMLLAAQMARATYLIDEKSTHEYVDTIFVDKGTHTLCLMAIVNGEAWIAFRGTANIVNIAVDLSFFGPKPGHDGVFYASEVHKRNVVNWLRAFPLVSKINVTGHSLGGSIANRVGEALTNLYPFKQVEVYPFAPLRVYTRRGAKRFNNTVNSTQVINDLDIVPQLLGLRFKHVKKIMYFNGKGEISKKPHFLLWLFGIFTRKFDGKIDLLFDHRMSEHVKLMRKYAKRNSGKH